MMSRILACFCLMFLAAVAPAQSQDTPRRGGVLTLALSEPDNLDCHAALGAGTMSRLLPHYSSLLKIDPANYPNIVGDVAETWVVSSDGLTYTFKLRPDVLFHDGTPLTSADVKATFERLRKPQGGALSVRQSLFADIGSVETPDALTVIFRLTQPNATMLITFANPYNCLYSAARLAQDPKFPEKTVMGTGPFKFVSYTPGGDWKSERFDKYFVPGKPYLDGFVAHTVARSAKVTTLVGGQAMIDYEGLTPAQRDNVMAAAGDRFRALEVPWTGALIIGFNTQKKPFDDVRVRRALTLAIDHWAGAKLLERTMEFPYVGGFQRTGSPFGLSAEELEKKPGFSRDIEASRAEARRLLAEAGQSNLKFSYLNREQYVPLGVFLTDQWRQIGVTVENEIPPFPIYSSRRASGAYDVSSNGLTDIIDDPTIQLGLFPSRSKNAGNAAAYDDPKVDALFEKQTRAANFADRQAAYRELENYMFEQSYYTMAFWGRTIVVIANEVQGFTLSPAKAFSMKLENVWLKQ